MVGNQKRSLSYLLQNCCRSTIDVVVRAWALELDLLGLCLGSATYWLRDPGQTSSSLCPFSNVRLR